MANRTTGKQRASRIPLDYYKKPDRLARIKLWLTFLAMLAALGWWASGIRPSMATPFAPRDEAVMRYSHGPVANVHAMWDSRCDACHVPFRPIGEDSWASLVNVHAERSEAKCMACHKVEDHHENQKPGEARLTSCASCHRDHRGRDASLVRLADSDCTSCHADLKNHAKTGKAEGFLNVSSFPGNHPEFARFRVQGKADDPGTLKFNHRLHLAKGLSDVANGMAIMKVRDLTNAGRERYAAGLGPDEGVQLDCGSCHRLETGSREPFSSRQGSLATFANPLPGTGAYMQPITYRTDCVECHALRVPMTNGPPPDDPRSPAGLEVVPVPHHMQPPALHRYLENASVGVTINKGANLLEKFTPSQRVLPGAIAPDEVKETARQEVQARVAAAEKILYGAGHNTCTECHKYTVGGIPQDRPDPNPKVAFSSNQIHPTYVPTIWYEHANFDHSAHRAVSCRECHASAGTSATSDDVLIPGKASCVKCHAPESRDDAGLAAGGAGHSCTECHRYHGADHKRGPSMAKSDDTLDFAQFLSGNTRKTATPAPPAGRKPSTEKSPSP